MNLPLPYKANSAPEQMPIPVQAGAQTAVMTPAYVQEGWTLKEKIIVGIAGVAVIGGGFYLVRKAIRNHVADKEEGKTFQDGSVATYAKQLKMAFENDGWPGTDEDLIRNTLRQITSKEEFRQVVASYEKLYSSNLIKDMSDELTSTEYAEMLQIIAAKPEKKGQTPPTTIYPAWAKRLKAAFDKTYAFLPGTDSEAIVAVLREIPTQKAFILVGGFYQKLYGTNLLDDMKAEAEWTEFPDWLNIIMKKPKQ